MEFDKLFDLRVIAGDRLKDCMRVQGFSKASFCKKADISRPTLDRILSGEIDSKSTFDKHFLKILTVLQLSVDEFLQASTPQKSVEAVYSQNAPKNYQMDEKAKKQYDLLLDVLNLCEIYY